MTSLLALAGLLTLVTPAPAPALATALATDLDKSLIPASTPFLVHVDVRGILGSTLGKAAREQAGEELDGDLDELRDELGIDPFEDIYSVTLFSATGDTDGGAVLVRASAAIDGALERLKQMDEYEEVQVGGTSLHTIDGEVFIKVGKRGDERIVVASDSAEEVVATLAVLRGDARSLADERTPALKGKPRPGAFVFVEVGEAMKELTGHIPNSKLAGLAKHLVFQIGESRGRIFVEAAVDTDDGQAAENLGNVLNGLLSLARLIGAGGGEDIPPFALELLDDIRVQVAGTQVRLTIEVDGRALVEHLKDLEDF